MTPTLHELHEQLRACQKRLGTPAETAGDMEHALSLAHAINNRLSGVLLMAEIRRPEKSSVLDWRRYLLYHRSVRS